MIYHQGSFAIYPWRQLMKGWALIKFGFNASIHDETRAIFPSNNICGPAISIREMRSSSEFNLLRIA